MDWLSNLFFGEGIAHSVMVLAMVIASGIFLGRMVKFKGITLGITWILFMGIVASHFGMRIEPTLLSFIKEFGLILFVYSIGLQVGPGFFSSFKSGGMRLVGLAAFNVLLTVGVTIALFYIVDEPMSTLVGVMSGAVTNTPGLGAAQTVYTDTFGVSDPSIASGYAVAYPLGVAGVILSFLILRGVFRIKLDKENEGTKTAAEKEHATRSSIEFINPNLNGLTVMEIGKLINRPFVISRIRHADDSIEIASGSSRLTLGDKLLVISNDTDQEAIMAFLGRPTEDMKAGDWVKLDSQLVSRKIMVTQSKFNGHTIGSLHLRNNFGVNVTRVTRSGVDLVARPNLELQFGDKLLVVGTEAACASIANMLGNSTKQLREPNLIAFFVGILMGVILGSIPIAFPGLSQPVKLGLAGGPMIVAIIMSRFGPHFKFVTYTTVSANLMLREIGISLFLAAVGLGAGETFVPSIVSGGYWWILYGLIITIVPVLIGGVIARLVFKMNFFSILGMLAGSNTNPIALAYANSLGNNDTASVSYSTVYPFVMFLRVLVAQILVLM
ncbi:MAG: putative transporter [Rikenellaceae bacterium]|nr:putative transporter [Rikenellaceae bacterium]